MLDILELILDHIVVICHGFLANINSLLYCDPQSFSL